MRTTHRWDFDLAKDIRVHKVENGGSAGGTRLWNWCLMTFFVDAATGNVRTLLVSRQVDSLTTLRVLILEIPFILIFARG